MVFFHLRKVGSKKYDEDEKAFVRNKIDQYSIIYNQELLDV
jgi:hypothetical protein